MSRAGFWFTPSVVVEKYGCMAYDSTGTQAAEVATLTMADPKRTDHEIVDAVRGGDEAAFGEIIERYRGPITNFLYRILNDYEEAVDLAQESFVRVYFALDRYHKEYAFSTYLYRIASNLAISELRRRKRRRLVSLTGLFGGEDEQDVEFQPPDTRVLPEDETIDKEREQVIVKAIASLPDKYRLPIVLRDVQGHSYEEVATILELGLGTTKSRISRGRGLLKGKLEKYFVSDGN